MANDSIYKELVGQSYRAFGLGGGAPQNSFINSNVFTSTKSKSSNKDFKVKIAQGVDAGLPYTRVDIDKSQVGTGFASYKYKNGVIQDFEAFCECRFLPPTSIAFTDDLTLRDRALGRLKNRLASDEEKFKSIVPIKEINETRDMVKGFIPQAESVIKSLLDLKRGRLNLVDVRKQASDIWLTWSFGVSPTIADIQQAARAVARAMNPPHSSVQRYTGTASKDWMELPSSKTTFNLGSATGTASVQMHKTLSYKYIAGVRHKLASGNNYSIQDFNQQFGLTLGDILPAVWETIPYSWLLDYFTTAGAFLDDTFTSSSGNTVYVCLNTRFTYDAFAYNNFTYTSAAIRDFVQHGTAAKFKAYSFQRSILSGLPHRSFRFKTIDEIGVNSINRLLNLNALLLR